MATRADRNLLVSEQFIRTVETGQTVAVGRMVKDGNADKECQHSGANESGIGVVTAIGGNPQVTAGAAGDRVTVQPLTGGIIPVKVGTGGATRGLFAKAAADGLTDATPAAAAANLRFVAGVFTQSGSAGDLVGMIPMPHYITEA